MAFVISFFIFHIIFHRISLHGLSKGSKNQVPNVFPWSRPWDWFKTLLSNIFAMSSLMGSASGLHIMNNSSINTYYYYFIIIINHYHFVIYIIYIYIYIYELRFLLSSST